MTWQDELQSWLEGASGIAVLGLGNELSGDDGIGFGVITHLHRHTDFQHARLIPIWAGTVPETAFRRLRVEAPSHILVVDAARFGGVPGDIRLFTTAEANMVPGTHSSAPDTWQMYLSDLNAKWLVLGVEPECTEFGASMGARAKNAVRQIIEFFMK